MPTATLRPPTSPSTPSPGRYPNRAAASGSIPRPRAPARMAAASGCSLPRSRPAARRSSSSSDVPAPDSIRASTGFPTVRVPVLSMSSRSTLPKVSSASALRTRMPAPAPRAVPTMMAMGVASPSAHGQAMMSTATAFTSA